MFKKLTKKTRRADRLIKGIIVGGAIGSVVGMTLAPKSGKDTRSFLKNSSLGLFSKILFFKKKTREQPIVKTPSLLSRILFKKKEAPIVIQKKSVLTSFLRGMRALIFGREKK